MHVCSYVQFVPLVGTRTYIVISDTSDNMTCLICNMSEKFFRGISDSDMSNCQCTQSPVSNVLEKAIIFFKLVIFSHMSEPGPGDSDTAYSVSDMSDTLLSICRCVAHHHKSLSTMLCESALTNLHIVIWFSDMSEPENNCSYKIVLRCRHLCS